MVWGPASLSCETLEVEPLVYIFQLANFILLDIGDKR
ncbi:hypothetical protein CPS_0584 [Colwellia psychrerythraea 34H]|uniref:Uncharacterized protein n=1 Tax=Colwellia psychrerythraea (strain 34H / ATCC BAA-681) TaxID=167879 RepID=Q489D0_COLP3|nr:hypothetical protein CPS_0584 [Colwellia psychrerythraea 34H]